MQEQYIKDKELGVQIPIVFLENLEPAPYIILNDISWICSERYQCKCADGGDVEGLPKINFE